MSTTNRARSLRPDGIRVMVSPRVWSHMEGTQVYADLRAIGAGVDPATRQFAATDLSLIRKLVEAPVTRKDKRYAVYLTPEECAALRTYVEAMQAGASDNTWDADGRADLFAANALLEQLRKAGH